MATRCPKRTARASLGSQHHGAPIATKDHRAGELAGRDRVAQGLGDQIGVIQSGPCVHGDATAFVESARSVDKSRHERDELAPLGLRQGCEELVLDAVDDFVELEKLFDAFGCDRDDVSALVLRID